MLRGGVAGLAHSEDDEDAAEEVEEEESRRSDSGGVLVVKVVVEVEARATLLSLSSADAELDDEELDAERFRSEGGVRKGMAGRVKCKGRAKRLLLQAAAEEADDSAMGMMEGMGEKYEPDAEAYESVWACGNGVEGRAKVVIVAVVLSAGVGVVAAVCVEQ